MSEPIPVNPNMLKWARETAGLEVDNVVTIAMAMASFAGDTWHIPVNTDLLLAGAMLHDVCKVVECAPEEGKPGKRSAIGENLVHGAYGVHLALNAGLPLRVVHLIGSHTPQVSQLPKVVEGIFICYADYAAADIFHLGKGMPLLLDTTGLKLSKTLAKLTTAAANLGAHTENAGAFD